MKVLIVGKNSYIGNHIQQWIEQKEGKHAEVVQLEAQTDEWKTFDYSGYDAVVQVAGIVHHPEVTDWELYKNVNADLPIAIAKLAKEQGVKQFVFLSTMAVYGVGKRLTVNLITKDTPCSPRNMYAKSKYLAEQELKKLANGHFHVVIVRPPNVYGKGCKGGYIPGFVSIVKKLPVIPFAFDNVRQSMIYIDNFASFVYQCIKHSSDGLFMPQDDKAVSANDLTNAIAIALGKSLYTSKILGLFVHMFSSLPLIQKAFGGLEYDKSLSANLDFDYLVVPFNEGIKRTIE